MANWTTIAFWARWVHGDHDAAVLPQGAGDGLGVVVDGEVGAGVAVAGAGLRGGAAQQRPDQRDPMPGGLGHHQGGAEVPRIEVVPSRGQGLSRRLVIDGAGHLVVGDRGVGGGHMGDQVRERRCRAGLVMATSTGPARADVGAGALRGVVTGFGDVQLVAQPEGVPFDAHRASASYGEAIRV